MTTNKPEVVGFATHHDEPMLFPSKREAAMYCDEGEEPVALIRLSDYEALQAEQVPDAIKLLQRVSDKTTEGDPFEAERLAIKFCEQRGLEDRSVMYRLAIDAFTVAYRMRPLPSNTPAAPSHSQQSAEPRKCCGNPVMDNGYVCCGDYLYGDDAIDSPHSQQSVPVVPHWIAIDCAEDAPAGDTLVVWDGCDISVDFTDTEVDYGTTFWSNGTEATHYLAGLNPPDRCPSHESEQVRDPVSVTKSLERYAERAIKNAPRDKNGRRID